MKEEAEKSGYLDLRALAKYSGLSVRTLRSHLTAVVRPLPHYKVGGKILVGRVEFDAWIKQFRDAGESATNVGRIADQVLRDL